GQQSLDNASHRLRNLLVASDAQSARLRSDQMIGEITIENVSKFYGEVLGVNRVNLSIPPGITSLVGPNGAGKTTLMNLMTGLIQPTRGTIRILGHATDEPEKLFKLVGYSTQFDSFPKGLPVFHVIYIYLTTLGIKYI